MKSFRREKSTCFAFSLIAVFLLSGHHAAAGMIDNEGMRAWEICAMCHSADGISRMPKFPKLAGQKAEYIEQQLMAFREGLRTNDGGQMQAISNEVLVEDVERIAQYFAQLKPDDVSVSNMSSLNPKELEQARQLFNVGRHDVPSCAGCHSDLTSFAPWLEGQHQAYLKKQLVDFKTGKRQALNSDEKMQRLMGNDEAATVSSMNKIAERLSDNEIEILAAYLSTAKPTHGAQRVTQ